jgi:hypothetical protein
VIGEDSLSGVEGVSSSGSGTSLAPPSAVLTGQLLCVAGLPVRTETFHKI